MDILSYAKINQADNKAQTNDSTSNEKLCPPWIILDEKLCVAEMASFKKLSPCPTVSYNNTPSVTDVALSNLLLI